MIHGPLFTRLNVGRIPLTNAELVKALLLATKGASSVDTDAPQRDGHRQIEIATQWDMIERDLHEDGFWAFLSNRLGTEFPTRIEFIFNLMAGNSGAKELFHTFFHFKKELESQSSIEVWAHVLELFYLLKEWYEDHHLYHKIGYLVATGENLVDLVRESKGSTKSKFNELLDARITDWLDLTEENVQDLSYEKPHPCTRLLLLFNVETVRNLTHSTDRYPFHAHKRQPWSLEHIHAQQAENLNKKEQWQEWLRQHGAALEALQLEGSAANVKRDSLLREIAESIDEIKKESFAQLSIRAMELFQPAGSVDNMHSISNLALLTGGSNSALSNSVFQVKRLTIIKLDRAGDYIPICTRRVFFKYYTDAGDQQLHLWSPQDRKCYLDAMINVLRPYLKANARIQG